MNRRVDTRIGLKYKQATGKVRSRESVRHQNMVIKPYKVLICALTIFVAVCYGQSFTYVEQQGATSHVTRGHLDIDRCDGLALTALRILQDVSMLREHMATCGWAAAGGHAAVWFSLVKGAHYGL